MTQPTNVANPFETDDTAQLQEEIHQLKGELNRLAQRLGQAEAQLNPQGAWKHFQRARFWGLEIGRDFFRGQQGSLQFKTNLDSESIPVVLFVPEFVQAVEDSELLDRSALVGFIGNTGPVIGLAAEQDTDGIEGYVSIDANVTSPTIRLFVSNGTVDAGLNLYSEFGVVYFDESRGLRLTNADADPTAMGDGQAHYRTDLDRARLRANGAWVSLAHLSDALTAFTGGGNWKVLYQDGSGVVTELALGASGTVLTSNGATSAPTFETPSGGGMELIVQEAEQTVDNGSTGTTLVDTELLFAMAANEVYQFEGVVFYLTTANPDIKFNIAAPAGAVGHVFWEQRDGTAFAADELAIGTNKVYTTPTNSAVFFKGAVHNGGNAGNLGLQFAQNSAHADDTTVRAGSYMKWQLES